MFVSFLTQCTIKTMNIAKDVICDTIMTRHATNIVILVVTQNN